MKKMSKKTAREALNLAVKNFNALTHEAKGDVAKRINELEEFLGYERGYFTGIVVAKTQVFPMTGYYLNDCPFCKTHNALLEGHDSEEGLWVHKCRDCDRKFTASHTEKTYTLLNPDVRPLKMLRVGDILTPAEVAKYFGGKAGWNGGVYVCDGSHKDGTSGFKVLEVRSSRPSWSF